MFHDASGVVLCALTCCQVAPALDSPTFKMPFLFCKEFLKKLIKKGFEYIQHLTQNDGWTMWMVNLQ